MIYQGYEIDISVEITCSHCNETTKIPRRGAEYWSRLRTSADLREAMSRLKCPCGGAASKLVFDRRLIRPGGLTGERGPKWEDGVEIERRAAE